MVHNRCNKLSYELYEQLMIGDNEGCQQILGNSCTQMKKNQHILTDFINTNTYMYIKPQYLLNKIQQL